MTTAVRQWRFEVDRFDLRSRNWYATRFEAVESVIARWVNVVRSAMADDNLSTEGRWRRLLEPKADAYGRGVAILDEIKAASAEDHAAVDKILAEPEPPRPSEVLNALLYRQALELRRFDGDGDDPDMLTELQRAIDAGDAIGAEVLADLAPTVVRPKGPGDFVTAQQLLELQNAAKRLRAPYRRQAFALLDTLNGDGRDPGVDVKLQLASAALGPPPGADHGGRRPGPPRRLLPPRFSSARGRMGTLPVAHRHEPAAAAAAVRRDLWRAAMTTGGRAQSVNPRAKCAEQNQRSPEGGDAFHG
jgi:hypothetical protein